MTEPTPMTDERLESLRQAWSRRFHPGGASFRRLYGDEFDELSGEIDRLRAELAAKEAECEWLRGALTGIADDVCWMGCTMRPPKEWKSQPRFQPVEHEEDCPKRMAYAALNPEAAE